MQTVTIDERFCGPPNSGNGGYSAGLLASALLGDEQGAVEVTLKAPPPLDEPLAIRMDCAGAKMLRGDVEIAVARLARLEADAPPAPTLDEARAAAARFAGFERHIYPGCFVCGPAREAGDGLRIFAGPVEGREFVAAPWTPGPDMADDKRRIRPEFLWAAMDCPSYFAFGDATINALLGRMTAEIYARPEPGAQCIVAAWPRGREGRKLFAAAALYGAGGELAAYGETIWIELRN
ncbi:MAG: hypothetical protein Tsb0010_03620 [Parvularculaceae bacterium]